MTNPLCGREVAMKVKPAQKTKKVIIVGGGPGGLESAWIAASRGHQVILYEKGPRLGGQFRIGAIPPAKQDIARAVAYWINMCNKNGVHFKLNTEATAELILAENPDVVILATGGEPLVPDIKGISSQRVVTAVDVLQENVQVGPRVLIIGGGMVGCETADYLGAFGYKITIVEMLPSVAGDLPRVVRTLLLERLQQYGVRIETGITVQEILDNGLVGMQDGQEVRFTNFDNIVLATGVKPVSNLKKELDGRVPELYVIGDAASPRTAMEALAEGAEVAVDI